MNDLSRYEINFILLDLSIYHYAALIPNQLIICGLRCI